MIQSDKLDEYEKFVEILEQSDRSQNKKLF